MVDDDDGCGCLMVWSSCQTHLRMTANASFGADIGDACCRFDGEQLAAAGSRIIFHLETLLAEMHL